MALALALTWHVPALSDERTGMGEDLREWGELAPIRDRTGVSMAPIIAYEPTFGSIFGAALFLDRMVDPRYYMYARLAFSTEGEYSTQLNYKRWMRNGVFFHLDLEVDDFARPYYGEGMDTDESEKVLLEGTVARALYFIRCVGKGRITFGPFLDFRAAWLDGVDGTAVLPPEYDERTLGFGVCFLYDSRDSQLSPTRGVHDSLTLRLVPENLSSFEGGETFSQVEVEHRAFTSPSPGLVLAGRVHLGGTLGRPSYQYRYSLGGPYALRGLYTNRFRGDNVYIVQAEVRRKLFGIFTGALFAEAGEVSDSRFEGPEFSGGGGVRMTLPPDHVAKIRLDAAWARDQNSIYLIFGEAF